MLVLGIDTSSAVATVALGTEEKLLGEITINHTKTHSQKLMPIINQLLQNLDVNVEDIDLIGVAVGPGSFTGVRIGISAVKGLSQPYNIPIAPISSLMSMGYNLYGIKGYICPIFDARRDQVYTTLLNWNDEKLETIIEDSAMTIEELVLKLKEFDENITFIGDGVYKHKEFIKVHLESKCRFANSIDNMQSASSVVMASLNMYKENYISYGDLDGNYLRKSEAERTYEEKQGK